MCNVMVIFLLIPSEIIMNGYPPEKIVMGMESGQFTKDNFQQALDEVKKIQETYPAMGVCMIRNI